MKNTNLNVYAYMEYRDLIRDRMAELHEEHAKFSKRYFVKKLGINSPGYLARVVKGERNLSEPKARLMAAALGLGRAERAFFMDLFAYNTARSTEAKADALARLRQNRQFINVHQLALDRFDYMTDPIALVLREMISFPTFRNSVGWIAARLPYRAKARQIREAVSRLLRLGLVEQDGDGGLRQAHRHQSTGHQFGSLPLRQFHLNMLSKGREAMELPVETRFFRGITMSVNKRNYGRMIEEIEGFVSRMRAILEEENDPDSVYHMELCLFPLTKPPKSDHD